MRLWADDSQSVSLVMADLACLSVVKQKYLISNRTSYLDLVWKREALLR